MIYTIGEVSKMTDIPVPTLRYYDKEGLFNKIERSEGGIRKFSDGELLTIKWINCLKSTGMSLKDIKKYLDWNNEGDDTLEERLELFKKREIYVRKQMEELEITMAMIKLKQWWYETSIKHGGEDYIRDLKIEDYPEEIAAYVRKAFSEGHSLD